VDVEEVLEALPEGELAGPVISRPVLRPDKIEDRAGQVLPADDQVRPELEEIEVRVRKRVVGEAVAVLIDAVGPPPAVSERISPGPKR
jgi:hypothetical protein